MNIYLDTEFLEGTQKRNFLGMRFGETKPTIELISIGLVTDEMTEYYGICNEFNLKEAWNRFDLKNVPGERNPEKVYWLRENVLKKVFEDLVQMDLKSKQPLKAKYHRFTYWNMRDLLALYGKNREEIAADVLDFVGARAADDKGNSYYEYIHGKPVFKGYYCDYDWVVFCWIFGKMIDLPKGFPMYCYDLQQKFDDKIAEVKMTGEFVETESSAFLSDHDKAMYFKSRSSFPKLDPDQEHSAIWDARWTRAFDYFIDSHIGSLIN